ncbi:ferredoxin [Roseovarius sp. A21]|uniref:Ferredoxin n=1 Tax=Roseovarius bejariae TaxID=2576383 RepID=A0A844CYP2_9RHOB|nr:ferredoxin [Roseovarius bejariae]MRU15154.1 ferredoxin [Roseovarius bejariae]
MNLEQIEKALAPHHLTVFGGVGKDLPEGIGTLVLLGPRPPGFWPHFTTSAEYTDDQPDPLDRWSKRVITKLAQDLGAEAFFPFDGPPWQPFVQWAIDSGRAHVSPVGLLIHDEAGLMISYRGALGFTQNIALPEPPPSPCDACTDRPCLSACPVDALTPHGYDVAACKTDLDRAGNDCLARGCAVRRACPVSQSHGRTEGQSAFHMRAFK